MQHVVVVHPHSTSSSDPAFQKRTVPRGEIFYRVLFMTVQALISLAGVTFSVIVIEQNALFSLDVWVIISRGVIGVSIVLLLIGTLLSLMAQDRSNAFRHMVVAGEFAVWATIVCVLFVLLERDNPSDALKLVYRGKYDAIYNPNPISDYDGQRIIPMNLSIFVVVLVASTRSFCAASSLILRHAWGL